jgi:dTDP-4-amino-4,6-dideoxygalactose transaminase
MVVHIAGLITPQIEALIEVCRDHHVFLIEDAAHAHGAIYKDRMAGSLGDVGCFSFYPTKVLTSGEGGMVCTNMPELTEKAKVLRYDGIRSDGLVAELGYNWHPSEFHSILGLYQLARLEEFIQKRNEVAERYEKGLKKIRDIKVFSKPSFVRHSFYKFPVLVEKGMDAEGLMGVMRGKYGVEIGRVYYPPCHLQPLYRSLFGFKAGVFPVAEDVLKRVICLPMHAGLRVTEVDYVLESLGNALDEK